MEGVIAAAAQRAGIPEDVAQEVGAEVRQREWTVIERYLADRLHQATMHRLSSLELAKLGENPTPIARG